MAIEIPRDASAFDDARPTLWPADAGAPETVLRAEEAIRSARSAWLRERRALKAEVRIAPAADLLARDDPPRLPQLDLELRPEASLAWSPLRSETLLAEARVVEAEAAWLEAWIEATLAAWTLPVRRDRAQADLDAAEQAASKARRLAAAPSSSDGDLDANADADADADVDANADVDADVDADGPAAFDLREARLDLDDAGDDVAAIEAEIDRLGLAPAEAGGAPRPEPDLPSPPDPVTTRAYRARALRSAADVARSERRWRAAIVPLLSIEAGYAGSDGRIEGSVEMRHGRPSASVDAALVGTPRERGWASLSAAFRWGTDMADVRRALDTARVDEVDGLAAFEEAWRSSYDAEVQDYLRRLERWRLAEDRLRATPRPDPNAGRRERDRARRSWLRMVDAYRQVLMRAEAWPRWTDGPPAVP